MRSLVWMLVSMLVVGGLALGVSAPASALAVQTSETSVAAVAAADTATEVRFPIRRVVGPAPAVDGRLDDAVWTDAEFRSDFRQKGRDRAFDPRVETRVALAYDDEAIYVGARMESDREGGPRELLGRRDEASNSERLLLSFDTFNDRQSAYTFGVTVGGVRVDYISSRDIEGWIDDSFDPSWDARVTVDSAGWTAEMRIPFDQMRFSPGDEHGWGFNIRRWDPATFLNLYWVVIPYDEAGWVSRFGTLDGLDGIDGGTSVQITPYALSRTSRFDGAGGDGTFGPVTSRYGGDLRAGLGSSFMLSATVNPDFGQVEADPARVNLSGFETFFPERRPFFVEGQELFRARGPNWFYSRRVGSTPALSANPELVEQIESATILGGAKLTGRLPSGLSVGMLTAVGDRETISGTTPETGLEVSPRSFFGVGRVVQELGSAGSSIGAIATVVERSLDPTGALASSVAERAITGGTDLTLRLADGMYELSGFGGGSLVQGSPAAMSAIQQSTTHLFQRPDADHVDLETNADQLTGWTGGVGFGKIGGAPWLFDVSMEAASPAFEIRDAGSQRRSDRIDAGTSVSYTVRAANGLLRTRSVGVGLDASWNFGGTRRALAPSAFFSGTWANVWTTTLEVGTTLPALSDDLTRGGPLMGTLRSWWGSFGLAPGRTGGLWWGLDANGYRDEEGGWSASASGSASLQLGSRVALSTILGGAFGRGTRQYAGVVDDAGGGSDTFGARYLFTGLDRDEIFAQLRSEITLATDAVLTLYAEPFVSTGRADGFGELTRPRATELREYGTDGTSLTRLEDGAWMVEDGPDSFRIENIDYWVRSFRASAVFRWEWRDGSSFFLIWQKDRWSFTDRLGSTSAGTFFEALRDPGQDVLVAKVSLMLGM